MGVANQYSHISLFEVFSSLEFFNILLATKKVNINSNLRTLKLRFLMSFKKIIIKFQIFFKFEI